MIFFSKSPNLKKVRGGGLEGVTFFYKDSLSKKDVFFFFFSLGGGGGAGGLRGVGG